MENISWTDRVRNEEVLHGVKEERNIKHTIKRRKANWIGHILRRKFLLKHIIIGKIEEKVQVTGIQRGRRKQLLYHLKETSGYWKVGKKSTVSQSMENSLWKSLLTFRKTDNGING